MRCKKFCINSILPILISLIFFVACTRDDTADAPQFQDNRYASPPSRRQFSSYPQPNVVPYYSQPQQYYQPYQAAPPYYYGGAPGSRYYANPYDLRQPYAAGPARDNDQEYVLPRDFITQ